MLEIRIHYARHLLAKAIFAALFFRPYVLRLRAERIPEPKEGSQFLSIMFHSSTWQPAISDFVFATHNLQSFLSGFGDSGNQNPGFWQPVPL